jgi:WD40 repeat protein
VGIVSVAFSPEGRFVATARIDRSVQVWDPTSWDVLATIPDGRTVRTLAFSADGRWLARAGGDGDIRLLDLNALHEEPGATAGSHGNGPGSRRRIDPRVHAVPS